MSLSLKPLFFPFLPLFLGIFIGGLLGGWLYSQFSFQGVYFFCMIASFIWLAIAYRMQVPRTLITHVLSLLPHQQKNWDVIAAKLNRVPGIAEIIFVAEESKAYLKMERHTIQHPDFIHLKEQLQLE